MMKKGMTTLAIAMSLMLGVVGCAGGNQPQQSGKTSGQVIEISASNFQFKPNKIEIPANKDVTLKLKVANGMHSLEVPGLDVSLQGDGETAVVHAKPGTYPFFCNIPCGVGHSKMKGTIVAK
ncbi:cupredoxin domain-containing protein [Polycladomyces subterraneus]|uniref:Cupredoxin domain-containing protein n=1 Tax=Polycladomyces subterraneus TaxID=1016997 RepID=A0ABT8IJA4_9BACL|nr:cupredoxin domain-containing protein [Polycladomyces subterraneus]MDN4592866.1 cupredoxin domain-containing protein [Polycladomyces subterraneus]